MNTNINYYNILEINENATTDEVLSNYRKLSKKYHPDICKELDASEKFRLLTEAKEILEDEIKRKEYDIKRKGIIKHNNNSYSSFDFMNGYNTKKTENYEEFSNRKNKEKYTIRKKIIISLLDFYFDNKMNIKYKRRIQKNGFDEVEYKEFNLNGTYKFLNKKEYLIKDKGNQIPIDLSYTNELKFGDLILIIEEKKHPNYERKGYDLITTHKINKKEYNINNKIEYLHIDNQLINYKLPENFDINKPVKIPNKGLIISKKGNETNRGNLFIYIEFY